MNRTLMDDFLCEHCISDAKSLTGDDNFLCEDCKKDTCRKATGGKDYYMVQSYLWEKFGVGSGMLCIDCLEQRMGRKLLKKDFIDCPLNKWLNPYVANL